jgi:hypothetical protein
MLGASRAVERGMRAACLVAVAGCAITHVQLPPYVRQPTSALAVVPYPPPPARAERVPRSPNPKARWIDGEWTWHAHRWLWERGRWELPPPNAKYSPWVLVRGTDGTLYQAGGVWRDDATGAPIVEPVALGVADVSEAAVVDVNGDTFPAGRTLDARDVDEGY